MTAAERVARTQAQLRFAAIFSALLWGVTAVVIASTLEVIAGHWFFGAGLASFAEEWHLATVIGAATAAWLLWRSRYVFSVRRVALWIEEKAPALQYALITASDPSVIGDTSLLDAAIESCNMDRVVRPAVLTPIIYSMVALSVMVGLLGIAATAIPHAATRGIPTPNGSRISAPAGATANRLAGISVSVTTPAYAGGRVQTLDDPSSISVLAGSSVTIRGPGPSSGIGAALGTQRLTVGGRNSTWTTAFTVPSSPTTVGLTDRAYERVIAVIPIVDQPPSVTLLAPARDTVWRHVPAGAISFVARASDDIGLASGRFEFTVTTGSGELFKSVTGTVGAESFGGARTGALRASIDPVRLGLAAGSMLSVRAVVSDNNTLSGPSVSTSDTRTFRVARPDEYDSLAVDAAPPPPMEKSLLTERMLIMSADSLLRKRSALPPQTFLGSAGRIGLDQADLRKKVYGILYEQDEAGAKGGTEGDDEELDPQLVLNRDLKDAYDAMWDAERSLNIGEIGKALPFMKRAAAALERARLTNRLYLRGRPPRVVVNVEKVRLAAKEKGIGNAVTAPRSRADSVAARLDATLGAALAFAGSDPARFANALIRLRADAATTSPAFSAAIGEAVDSLRAGHDMTSSLVRARRALYGPLRQGNASVPWGGSWSGIR